MQKPKGVRIDSQDARIHDSEGPPERTNRRARIERYGRSGVRRPPDAGCARTDCRASRETRRLQLLLSGVTSQPIQDAKKGSGSRGTAVDEGGGRLEWPVPPR